jgi:L-amino acid N-acyltransferase YncA
VTTESRVRPAVPADAEAIAGIHAQGIGERVATFETNSPGPESVRGRIVAGDLYLVAEAEGRVIGFAKVGPYADPAPYYERVGEATVYVDRDARRQGAGRALLEALARSAERRGSWKLVAKVFSSNLASLDLMRSCGWADVGVHRRHGRLDGEWKDVIVLERLLGEAAN